MDATTIGVRQLDGKRTRASGMFLLRSHCSLSYRSAMADRGVPLARYRTKGVAVELGCEACAYARNVDLEAVIERLNGRGLDGPNVGFVELARHVTEPCPRSAVASGTRGPLCPRFPASWAAASGGP